MPVLATMSTITTYGTWLRGDVRGWVDDGVVFPADPSLESLDRQRLAEPPFYFERRVWMDVGEAMGQSLVSRLGVRVLALCVQSWHSHFVIAASEHDPSTIVKCAKDAIRWKLRLDRRIWGTGYDKRYCFDEVAVRSRVAYVERHNLRDGLPARPWSFIADH